MSYKHGNAPAPPIVPIKLIKAEPTIIFQLICLTHDFLDNKYQRILRKVLSQISLMKLFEQKVPTTGELLSKAPFFPHISKDSDTSRT